MILIIIPHHITQIMSYIEKKGVIMKPNLKCAIYTRVSTDNQAEKEFNSCESQEQRIRSFINSQENMKVINVYSDPGFTGANLQRPGLISLLTDITEKKINTVLIYKIDRLTRSPKKRGQRKGVKSLLLRYIRNVYKVYEGQS